MKCEYCEEEVEKGNMDVIETMNYKFYICDDCMLEIEEMLKEFITETKESFDDGLTQVAPEGQFKSHSQTKENQSVNPVGFVSDLASDNHKSDIHSQNKDLLDGDYK
jgi:protein-arginine kinase activator protein McsA